MEPSQTQSKSIEFRQLNQNGKYYYYRYYSYKYQKNNSNCKPAEDTYLIIPHLASTVKLLTRLNYIVTNISKVCNMAKTTEMQKKRPEMCEPLAVSGNQ